MANSKQRVYAVSVDTKINFFDNIVASSEKEAKEIVLRKIEEGYNFDYVLSGLLSDYTQTLTHCSSEIKKVFDTQEDVEDYMTVEDWKVAS